MSQVPAMLIEATGAIGAGGPPYVLDFEDGSRREATAQEIAAAEVAAARAAIKPVSSRQMIRALYRAGLLETIENAVAASGDVELKIEFAKSQEFQRNNPYLIAVTTALGKSDAEIDAVFALAASL